MQINRHNYEEFFLLYVDKELSAADRKAVDMFVHENPDLQIELDLLQDTVLSADDIVLDKKDWLYMEEGVSALQENLLLYADDELTAADKKTVEAMLATNKTARAEWALLKQTKLEPDMAVVFADKQSLYRKEGGRVVGFKWWRVAAAAVLLGFGLWAGVGIYKNNVAVKSGSEELVKKGNDQQQPKTPGTNSNNSSTATENTTTNNTAENNSITSTTGQDNVEPTTPAVNNQSATAKNKESNNIAPKESIAVQNKNNKKPDNNLPTPSLQNININSSNEKVVANVQPLNNNSSRVSGNNDAVVRTNPKENTNNVVIASLNNNRTETNITAVQVVNNTTADGENNNRYLNVDDDKEKRTALGGFLRKAKRVIERTTNVKTGEGVKIAGFEIALK